MYPNLKLLIVLDTQRQVHRRSAGAIQHMAENLPLVPLLVARVLPRKTSQDEVVGSEKKSKCRLSRCSVKCASIALSLRFVLDISLEWR